jgi:hypothetical protein
MLKLRIEVIYPKTVPWIEFYFFAVRGWVRFFTGIALSYLVLSMPFKFVNTHNDSKYEYLLPLCSQLRKANSAHKFQHHRL